MQLRNIIIGVLVILISLLILRECKNEPVILTDRNKEAKLYVHINFLESKIKELNKSIKNDSNSFVAIAKIKTKIVYRTKFDTLATIDTVYIELVKCDSIVRLDSIIIGKQSHQIKSMYEVINLQDSVDFKKDTLILNKDSDIKALKKEVRKQKRKVVVTKIVAVLAVAVIIVVSLIQ